MRAAEYRMKSLNLPVKARSYFIFPLECNQNINICIIIGLSYWIKIVIFVVQEKLRVYENILFFYVDVGIDGVACSCT